VATVHLQEILQGQRVLEAVEREIMGNLLQSGSVISNNEKRIAEYKELELFPFITPYSDRVWNTSEGLKYISRLDAKLQGEIELYYKYTISGNNSLVEASNEYIAREILGCEHKPKLEYEGCKILQKAQFANEAKSAELVEKESYTLLEKFHPTHDRLNSWLLRIFLGKEAPNIYKDRKGA
jgi:hypothetical protein